MKVLEDSKVFFKGQKQLYDCYSSFGSEYEDTGLHTYLQEKGVTSVFVLGLAFDYCVKSTAISAATLKYSSSILMTGTKSVAAESELKAREECEKAGVVLI